MILPLGASCASNSATLTSCFCVFFSFPTSRLLIFSASDDRNQRENKKNAPSETNQKTNSIAMKVPTSDLHHFIEQIRPEAYTCRQEFLVKFGADSGCGETS